MKKTIVTIILLMLAALAVYGQTNRPVSLDTAIKDAAADIDSRLAAKSRIALINFNAGSVRFSDYVLDELTVHLVASRQLTVVDRREIDLIRKEQNFQYSGDVDDDSMVALGRMLGVPFIVSGSLTEIDSAYRMVVRVLNVQTAAVEVQYRVNIANDRTVKTLLEGRKEKTAGDKIGTGALNILLGLGSYIEGDIGGGITLTAGYALAAGLIVVELTALDWDSPMVGVPITAGVVIGGVTVVYGFVRPFIYNRSPRTAHILDNTRLGIVPGIMPPSINGDTALAVQLSYSVKF